MYFRKYTAPMYLVTTHVFKTHVISFVFKCRLFLKKIKHKYILTTENMICTKKVSNCNV